MRRLREKIENRKQRKQAAINLQPSKEGAIHSDHQIITTEDQQKQEEISPPNPISKPVDLTPTTAHPRLEQTSSISKPNESVSESKVDVSAQEPPAQSNEGDLSNVIESQSMAVGSDDPDEQLLSSGTFFGAYPLRSEKKSSKITEIKTDQTDQTDPQSQQNRIEEKANSPAKTENEEQHGSEVQIALVQEDEPTQLSKSTEHDSSANVRGELEADAQHQHLQENKVEDRAGSVEPTHKTEDESRPNKGLSSTTKPESTTLPEPTKINNPEKSEETKRVNSADVEAPAPFQSLRVPLGRGIESLKKAVEADNAFEWRKAFDLYVEASYSFAIVMKAEDIPSAKAMLQAKVKECLDRAEQIKAFLDERDQKTRKSYPYQSHGEQRPHFTVKALQEKPNVKWVDVAGLGEAKALLQELVIFPIKFPHLFKGKRQHVKSMLLYGPPGSGKSYLAKAVATTAACTFFSVSIADFASRYIGESAQLIRDLFIAAETQKPSIIFIDEIDALFNAHGVVETETKRQIKSVIVKSVDTLQPGVIVLGATSTPWLVDSSIIECFQRGIQLGPPNAVARSKIFTIGVRDVSFKLTTDEFEKLGELSDGLSASDLEVVIQDGLLQPVRNLLKAEYFKQITVNARELWTPCLSTDEGAQRKGVSQIDAENLQPPPVRFTDLEASLRKTRPTSSKLEIERYHEWSKVAFPS